MSVIINAAMPWSTINFSFMTTLALHGSYISHGWLVGLKFFILKDRIPLRTLIFMPYDSQGISIIDPDTGSSMYYSISHAMEI